MIFAQLYTIVFGLNSKLSFKKFENNLLGDLENLSAISKDR